MDVTDPSSPPSIQPSEPPPSPMTYLHIDIIYSEILPKLPTKSLLRFKSVCKTFKTLIFSPEFTLLHLRHSPSSDRLLIIPATTTTLYFFPLHSLSTVPTTTFNWPQPTISVVGSCNGLLLIKAITRFIVILLSLLILNPITRTYIDVPSPVEAVELLDV